MTEHDQSAEWHPLDPIRSLRDLGRQALTGLQNMVDDALDCFGDDEEPQS